MPLPHPRGFCVSGFRVVNRNLTTSHGVQRSLVRLGSNASTAGSVYGNGNLWKARLEEKGVFIDPNTLYPLLRRLEGQGLLESRWETGGAKPRKYYQRTKYGTEIYEKLKAYWQNLSAGMERLLREEES